MEKNTRVIKLNSIEKVKDFVKRVSTFECDVDIKYGRYVIDAKSVMSIFSLDLLNPLKVSINSDDEEEIKRFNELMEEFK